MNFWWPFGVSKAKRDEVTRIFDQALAASRDPMLYTDGGVPDTIDGRFQLLGLFVALSMTRLNDKTMRQALFDRMFITCEVGLRQMGVGDLSVPHKIKPMMKAFHGHAKAYDDCLNGQGDWNAALRRNVYGTVESVGDDQIAVLRAAIDIFMKEAE